MSVKTGLDLTAVYEEAFLLLPLPALLVSAKGEFLNVTYAFLETVQSTTPCLKASPIEQQWEAIDSKSPVPQLADNWSGEVRWIGENRQTTAVRLVVRALGQERCDGYLIFADSTAVFQSAVDTGNTRQHRLESLGLYASSVAHDLNNVLTGVLGHVSFLKLALPAEATYVDSLAAISDGSRRAAIMTQHILEYSRGDEVDSRQLALGEVIRSVVQLMREMLPEGVSIILGKLDESLVANGDESQIRRAIMNLLVNARDASNGRGEISIQLSKVHLDDATSMSIGVAHGNYASLRVADTGAGIPPEIQKKIFEPFFTTKSSSGTGLGLANVLSIMQAHSGTVRFVTAAGQGTEFELLLPLHESEIALPVEEQKEVARGSERILVVDDEESVRMILQKSLEHLGYEVDVAEDGFIGLAMYQAAKGDYDLVVMDMIMPGMPGDELFFKLKEFDPEVAVLISSGYSSDRRTKAVLDGGGLGLIRKPFSVEELAEVVRSCLDGVKGFGLASRQ